MLIYGSFIGGIHESEIQIWGHWTRLGDMPVQENSVLCQIYYYTVLWGNEAELKILPKLPHNFFWVFRYVLRNLM